MNAVALAKVARGAVIGVVVLDIVALAGLSVRVTSTTTRTVRPVAAATVTVTASSTPPPNSSAPALPVGDPPIVAPVVDAPTTSAAPALSISSSAPPSSPATAPTTPPVQTSTQQACPIALKEPAASGGLQSLIDFAPAFGQFSAEAFAAAAAYQPALQLLGPILAQYPKLAPKITPLVGPLLAQWEKVLDSLYALLGPYYSPYRTQVLDAEGKLAAALAPYAQKLANSALGGCIVDVEAALVQDTTK